MSLDLRNKIAVVTGGGSGIGRALCQLFAADEARVVVADINEAATGETLALLETGDHLAVGLDVSNADAWTAMREQIIGKYGRVDILCNNAGVMRVGTFVDSPMEDWYLQSRINIDGVILGCKTFIKDMIGQGSGHIVNTSSLAGMIAVPDCSTYTASKYAVVGFSQSLAQEVADKGVQVSILAPGAVDTPMNDEMDFPAEDRLIPAEDVASNVLRTIKANDGRFCIFSHPEFRDMLEMQWKSVLDEYDTFNASQT